MRGDDLDAIREHFAAQAREQVVWTPEALDELARIVDSVPVEQRDPSADAA